MVNLKTEKELRSDIKNRTVQFWCFYFGSLVILIWFISTMATRVALLAAVMMWLTSMTHTALMNSIIRLELRLK